MMSSHLVYHYTLNTMYILYYRLKDAHPLTTSPS